MDTDTVRQIVRQELTPALDARDAALLEQFRKIVADAIKPFVTDSAVSELVNVKVAGQMTVVHGKLDTLTEMQKHLNETLDDRFQAHGERIESIRSDADENRRDIDLLQQLTRQIETSSRTAIDGLERFRIDLFGRDNPGPHDPKPVFSVISESIASFKQMAIEEGDKTRASFTAVAMNLETRMVEDYGNLEQRVKRLELLYNGVRAVVQFLKSPRVMRILAGLLGTGLAAAITDLMGWIK